MNRLYVNTKAFHIRDLSVRIFVPGERPKTKCLCIQGMTVINYFNLHYSSMTLKPPRQLSMTNDSCHTELWIVTIKKDQAKNKNCQSQRTWLPRNDLHIKALLLRSLFGRHWGKKHRQVRRRLKQPGRGLCMWGGVMLLINAKLLLM